jgi:hypothetical protein
LQLLELIRIAPLELLGRLLFGFGQALLEFGLDFILDRLTALGNLGFLVLKGLALFFDFGLAKFHILKQLFLQVLTDAPGQRVRHLEFMPATRAGDHPLFHSLYLIN